MTDRDQDNDHDHRWVRGASSKDQQESVSRGTVMSVGIAVIAAVMVAAGLYFASRVIVPVTMAFLAYLTLRPATVRLAKRGLSPTLSSAALMLTAFAVLAFLVAVLYGPLTYWLGEAPKNIAKLKENFQSIVRPLTILDETESQLEKASEPITEDRPQINVDVQKPGVLNETLLINTTGQVIAFIAVVLTLAFFMLRDGDELVNRCLEVIDRGSSRHEVMKTLASVQHNVGTYFASITAINVGLAAVSSLVMWGVGMPTPLLWGAIAGLFNFVPYLGPLAATGLVFLAASSVFEPLINAAAVAGLYYSVTVLEGSLVTPMIVGKTLRLGPLVVLLSVAAFGFLWGLLGVFLAIPMVITIREVCCHLPAARPIAVILGASRSEESACYQDTSAVQVDHQRSIEEMAH
ncbi:MULTISPECIES: AI-2E family transporter [Crateriforma]|uniref:AI-2 transport protein TqsA n=1 Tax=Crateriforma conspicua TaxID=2527996 RepID=A0A5C6FXN2_9PLAN|nr:MULTISPECIES: AI-2E family transporter [Crateriforma]TWU67146.1 AI-2 transport protein TqsA [Crateriforma conspicua]